MIAAFLLSFREGLEAALIIGIVLAYLSKTGQKQRKADVWLGVFGAVVVSVLFALLLFTLGAKLEGPAEKLFEGVTMLVAAGILSWMIFWMLDRGRSIKSELERSASQAMSTDSRWALLVLAFITVAREGIELALFLIAALFASSALATLSGGLLGLAAAVIVGVLIFAGAQRLDLRRFFTVTSVLLIFVAAGLVGHGVHELNEAGIVPAVIEHVWSTKSVLSDKSTAGLVLKALFGYNDSPSLTHVLSYVGYLLVIGVAVLRRRASPATVQRGRSTSTP